MRSIVAAALLAAVAVLVAVLAPSGAVHALGVLPVAGFTLLAVVAIVRARHGMGRASRAAHALMAAAAACGALGSAMGLVHRPATALALPAALATQALLLTAFVASEAGSRRWRRGARATADAGALAALVVCAQAVPLALVSSPSLPLPALALLLGLVVTTTLHASFAIPGSGWRTRASWVGAAGSLFALGAVEVMSLVVQHHWLEGLRARAAVVTVSACGLAALVASGLLDRPPARSGDVTRRLDAWLFALEAVAGTAVALVVLASLEGPPSARLLAQSAFLVGVALVLLRDALARGEWHAAWREAESRRGGPLGDDRAATLAELARLVAHELRNSLSVLFASASFLERERPPEERAKILRALNEEGDRMARLADELSDVARQDDWDVQSLPLHDVLRAAAERALARAAWPAPASLQLELPSSGLMVRGNWHALEAALVGVLSAAAELGAARVQLATEVPPDSTARVRVIIEGDEGVVTDDVLARRPGGAAGSGSGGTLALAVARRSVERHGGKLELSRNRRDGLHAVIELPLERG